MEQRYFYLYVLGLNPNDINDIINTTTVRKPNEQINKRQE